jgi:hypothetical protein
MEELFDDADRVCRTLHSVADGPLVGIYFVVIAALVCLVAEKVDLLESFAHDVLECIRLVPAFFLVPGISFQLLGVAKDGEDREQTFGKDVEGNLATDREGQAEIAKLLL